MNSKDLDKLEFSKVCDILSTFAITQNGKKLCQNLLPSSEKSEVEKKLQETSESLSLIYKSGNIPITEIADIALHMKKLESQISLTAQQLYELGKILRLSRELKEYFLEFDLNISEFPVLNRYFSNLYQNKKIENTIFSSITPDYALEDSASPSLAKIRREIRNIESSIKSKLNSYLHSKYIQESIVTIRNNRYVIPVKNEYRSEVKGLIHDISSTGSTVFIEPLSVFELNNELNQRRMDENNEIEMILQKLSNLFYDIRSMLQNNNQLITRLDFIFAKAKYSKALDASEPSISVSKFVQLLSCWHPLIDKELAVKNDIFIGKDFTSLIITGPNTGGKTVTLKTLGILSLMAMSGLHIPAKEGSSIYVFDHIYADIGDEQSIADSLSTFSSHMTNISTITQHATSESLVLLDELGSGTDPTEGANLAISILHFLHQKQILTVATTHYPELKEYALVTNGFMNASAQFHLETLSPTYKLLIGVPGTSNAFEISKRLGVSDSILDYAKSLMSSNKINLEKLLQKIHHDRAIIEKEKEEIIKNAEEVRQLKSSLLVEKQNLEKQKDKLLNDAKQQAKQVLLEAKEDANEILKAMENSKDKSQNNLLRNQLNEKIGNLNVIESKSTISSYQPLLKDECVINQPVWIPSLNQEGVIVSNLNRSGKVMVQVGNAKMSFDLAKLEKINAPKKEASLKGQVKTNITKKVVSSEINLIGKTVDEATWILDKYLDDAALSHLPSLRIIHGKGTGALKNGIHIFLKHHPHVASYRLGTFGEGETGVTIVELKK